jgi:hypothetical protein
MWWTEITWWTVSFNISYSFLVSKFLQDIGMLNKKEQYGYFNLVCTTHQIHNLTTLFTVSMEHRLYFVQLVKINFYYFLLFNTFKNCQFLWKYTNIQMYTANNHMQVFYPPFNFTMSILLGWVNKNYCGVLHGILSLYQVLLQEI